MPNKTKSRKISSPHEMIDAKTEDLMSAPSSSPLGHPGGNSGSKIRIIAVSLVAIVVLGVYLVSRGYIVAALVNGKPIFRWDVDRALMSRFGQQTMESMISERLIAEAADKQGIRLSKEEVDAKMNDLVKTLGPNVKIEDLLKYQGMTKEDFDSQIRLQLTVEKILGKDIVISDKDIDDFIAKNKETMTATDEAAVRGEARAAIQSAKLNEKIQPWFAQLKQKASIVRLVK